jgi:hypothetical protein
MCASGTAASRLRTYELSFVLPGFRRQSFPSAVLPNGLRLSGRFFTVRSNRFLGCTASQFESHRLPHQLRSRAEWLRVS